jgi:hypothetical protein
MIRKRSKQGSHYLVVEDVDLRMLGEMNVLGPPGLVITAALIHDRSLLHRD